MSSSKGYRPTTPDMTPLIGVELTKMNVMRHLDVRGAILSLRDLHRRMPGASIDKLKDAVRELVKEGRLETAFRKP